MKLVYLDKKDRVRAWLVSRRPLVAALVALVFCLLPLWHQSTAGRFVLEPVHHSIVRAEVPGVVSDIFVREGSMVKPGELLAKLRNLPLESEAAQAKARFAMASDRAISAQFRHEDYGFAVQERDRLSVESSQLQMKTANLEVQSPISGVVLTPQIQDRIGSYLTPGTELLEVADLKALKARIYVSEYDMYRVREGAPAKLHIEGASRIWGSRAASVTPVATENDPSLMDQTKFKGLRPPQFYAVEIPVPNESGELKPGMTGFARVYGGRRSVAGFVVEALRSVLGRKIW